MGFRFRKIFSLGKGMRLNLSKRGMSMSVGKPGATLNIGKRGIRPTVGLPGTGLSFTPSKSSNQSSGTTKGAASNSLINTIVGFISCSVVCVGLMICLGIYAVSGETNISTPTAEAQLSIQEIIASTAARAQTQTMISAPPSATPFILNTATMLPPVTLAPTWTIEPTQTPFIMNTMPVFEYNDSAACSCSGDTLNCSDFASQNSAQICFDYCSGQGVGDIHKLDQNNDGQACESLK